jgi:hypothetical protein
VDNDRSWIVIGRFGRPQGLKGFIRVISFTEPQQNIVSYKSWYIKLDGDWKSLLLNQANLLDKLTERQKTYIQRLGASLGREIVPIDLPLYRELMNLELIVDKGRRLALSKLGQEVYRYL